MRLFLLSGLMLCLCFSLSAQHIHSPGICGTHGDEVEALMMPRLLQNKRSLLANANQSREIQYVPVKFHLVAESDGDDRININDVLDLFKELNEDFAPLEIQFYLPDSEFNLLNNSAVYSNHTATIFSTMALNKDNNAINIWVVESADTDSGPGTTLAYYSPGRDWIVAGKAYVKAGDVTITHEIGHFFSLPHPFRGWDSQPHDQADWGMNAPAFSPGGIATEKVDGSNCETAGDRICDTPANYNLGLFWNGCDFTAIVLDPMGDTLDPEERLYMDYFLDCPPDEYYFTDTQQDLMIADLAMGDRNYLRQGPEPDLEPITESGAGISPAEDEVLPTFDGITFIWEEVPNAKSYLLEVSRFSSFTDNSTFQYITNQTEFTIPDALDEDRRYYWRVRPFNDVSCAEAFSRIRFETGVLSSSPEPDFVDDYRLSPNPIASQQNLLLEVNTEESFTGTWQLTDLTGRQVGPSRNLGFQAGNNQLTLPNPAVPAGIYFWQINTEEGLLSGRLIVTR